MLIPQKDPVGPLISVPFRRVADGSSTLAFLEGQECLVRSAPPNLPGDPALRFHGGWAGPRPLPARAGGPVDTFMVTSSYNPTTAPPSLFLTVSGETPILNESSGFCSQKPRRVFKLDFCLFQFLCRWILFPVKGRSALGSPSSSCAKASAPGPTPFQVTTCTV